MSAEDGRLTASRADVAWKRARVGAQFLGPATVVFVLVGLIPLLLAVGLSLLDYGPLDPSRDGRFVGMRNYELAFQADTSLPTIAVTTLWFALAATFLELVGGLALALWLWADLAAGRWLTSLLLLPATLSPLVVGLLWKLVLQSEFGAGTYLLRTLPGLGGISPLGGNNVLGIVILIDAWQWTPFVVVLLAAALATQPARLLEIAAMDGASKWQRLRSVTLPYLGPLLGFLALLRFVDSLREFDKVLVLTGGGPGISSETISMYLWRIAFKQWNIGYASALAVLVYLGAIVLGSGGYGLLQGWLRRVRSYV